MSMPNDSAPERETQQIHTVSVHNLVEFVLQGGDLTAGGFQKRDRAQAGTRGHKRVQDSRPDGYQTEVEIALRVEVEDFPIEIRGRIDGLYAIQEPVVIEEIKTTTLVLGQISEMYNPLHWAQAQWGALKCCRKEPPDGV
jgi:DNA excision repair protein ERCC-2